MHVVNAAVLEDWNELSDEQVVADVLAGHTALFELLMRRHNERVYRAARAIVRNDAEAEDVIQQSYVNAYAHLRQFNRQEQFATWLTRIVINESLARVREKQRYELLADEQSNAEILMKHDGSRSLECEAASEAFRAFLEPAIDRLPNGLREVFMLSEVEGMSTAEVSRTLEVSEDAVNTRLARARASLHHDLTERTSSFAPDAFRFYRPSCNRIVARVLSRIAGARRGSDMTKNTDQWDPLNEPIDQIRSEYREMPGLRLTFEQMLRLWQLDRRTGRILLKSLLDARFLEATSDGQYVRCDVRESIAQRRHQGAGLMAGGRTFTESHQDASD